LLILQQLNAKSLFFGIDVDFSTNGELSAEYFLKGSSK